MSSLRALVGAHKGVQFLLSQGDNPIGRAPGNPIQLYDPSVSNRHAVLVLSDGRAVLRDSGSKNGVLVNGIPVKGECPIKDGDKLLIGKCLFEYTSGTFSDGTVSEHTVELSLSSVTLEDLLRAPDRYSVSQIGAHGAQVLCRLASAVTAAANTDSLLEKGAEVLQKYLEAGSGFVGKSRKLTFDVNNLYVFGARGPESEAPFSATFVHEVLSRGEAVLFNELVEVDTPGLPDPGGSVSALKRSSVLYAPMRAHGQSTGIIGVSRDLENKYSDADLRFLALAADLMGMALTSLETKEKALAECDSVKSTRRSEYQIIGKSEAIRAVFDTIERVSNSDTTVLLTGETGTGKELVARAIHANSPRALKPFVALNCAVGTRDLLDDLLFGHVKGAFYGAESDVAGAFESADGGTLFLDEVAELSPEAQSKILRAVEEGEISRLGITETVNVDVRIVCATNRDLSVDVNSGRFREDLYYRIAVISLELPSLRERVADIPLLADHFLKRFRHKAKRELNGFTKEALDLIRRYPWPGNIRMLRNAVERAIILGTSDLIDPADLGLPLATGLSTSSPSGLRTLEEAEREHILRVLNILDWNQTKAAEALKINRKTLGTKLKEYGLKR